MPWIPKAEKLITIIKTFIEKTCIPQRHISEMENGKRVIGRKIARLFGEAFNIDYRFFL